MLLLILKYNFTVRGFFPGLFFISRSKRVKKADFFIFGYLKLLKFITSVIKPNLYIKFHLKFIQTIFSSIGAMVI